MSYKKFAASLLVSLLSGTCLFTGLASADEPELYFYPKNKWVVSRANSVDEPQAVCTVSNQLNNGYVLEMSGTDQGISNINIDFRQNAFQQNLKYEVQYSIPGVTKTIVNSRATKENLMVSDLSGKQDFAKELTSAGVLDVQIRNNNFRIYLTGLKASMPQFDDCVAPPEILAQDNINVPIIEDIETQDVTARSTLSEPKPVKGSLALPPPMKSALSSTNETEKNAVIDPKKLRPKHSDKPRFTELLAEKLKQENKKYQPEQSPVPSSKPDNMPQKLVETNESKAIPASPKKYEGAPVKTSNVTHEKIKSPKVTYIITKNEEPITVDFTREKQSNVAKNMSKVEPSSGQVHSSIINSDFVDMRNKISTLERELIAVRKNNSLLDEELKIALEESEKERMSVSSDNWNLERATMKFNESERQIMRLGRQLQTQRAVCEQEKTELENMLFDPKLTDQSQLVKLSSLEAELDEATSDLYRQKRQYDERIKLLEQQLQAP